MPARPPKLPLCGDPHDQPFFELAAVRTANFLVIGDRDLLVLAPEFSQPIVTADEFLGHLDAGRNRVSTAVIESINQTNAISTVLRLDLCPGEHRFQLAEEGAAMNVDARRLRIGKRQHVASDPEAPPANDEGRM